MPNLRFCISLLQVMKNVCMWTENEKIVIIIKWLTIDNKTNVQSIEVLVLCIVVVGMESVVHYELLEPRRTITADVYCQELDRANKALRQKSCTLVDKKKCYSPEYQCQGTLCKITQEKIRWFECTVRPHPSYASDLIPTEFDWFRLLEPFINGSNKK